MFSLHQKEDLVDQDHHPWLISFQRQDQKPADLDEHLSLVDRKNKTSSPVIRKKNGSRASNKQDFLLCPVGGSDIRTQKKMDHRENERQRRQEMTQLYASLRDLLPLEFIKGNRSISDHMHQAVHYITQMEKNVKALSMKRDQLSNTNQNSTDNTVSVTLCDKGVQVLMNSCLIEDGFMLSGVLNTLVEEGYNITSCILTKVNDRLLHSIHTEASDLALTDLSMLQERLVLIANTTNQPNFN